MDLEQELRIRRARVMELGSQQRESRERRTRDVETSFWRHVDRLLAPEVDPVARYTERVFGDGLDAVDEVEAARGEQVIADLTSGWRGRLDPPEHESRAVEVVYRDRPSEVRSAYPPEERKCTRCGLRDHYGRGNTSCTRCGQPTVPASE
jgi:hypothetical protein